MSLYNMVHGRNGLAGMILAMLNTTPEAVPRFRDAFYDGTYLCIYTRTGGGNRAPYYDGDEPQHSPNNNDLRALSGFVRDEDDDYDCTYATFFYTVPEQFAWFKEWADDKTERPASERWAEAIKRIEEGRPDDPLVIKMTAAMAPVAEWLKKATS